MSNRIVYIDVLRVFAIVLIITFHFLFEVTSSDFLRPIGFVGVSLFFIISGFLLGKKYPKMNKFSLKWFSKRYLSIAILYLAALLAIVFLFGEQTYAGDLYRNIAVHLTFLDPFFSPKVGYSIISSVWFLVPLVYLYFFFPYLNRFVRKDARLLLIPFVVMVIVRIFSGAWTFTSLNPLFFIGEFCFGIAVANNNRTVGMLISFLTLLVNPIMFIPFVVFYAFSFYNFKAIGSTRIIGLVSSSTLILFFFHEAFIKLILGKWQIYSMGVFGDLAIFLITISAAVYVSNRIKNYVMTSRFLQ